MALKMGSTVMWALIAFIVGLVVGYLASTTLFFAFGIAGLAVVLVLVLMKRLAWVLPILAGLLGMFIGRLVM